MLARAVEKLAWEVLSEDRKMAFISGPRQVGKTTLAKSLLERFGQGLYFNWDVQTDRRRLLAAPYFFEESNRNPKKAFLTVLDEIHKYPKWKNYLKGAFDKYHEDFRFLITGSGRLDLFKRGGDSLLGRYFSVPVFPLTVAEVCGRYRAWNKFPSLLDEPPATSRASREAFDQLLRFGGFPDPFLRAETKFHGRWSRERKQLLIREDIRDATRIQDLAMLENLAELLPARVASPLSLNNLRQDIELGYETLRQWIETLERFYYLFRLRPFAGKLSRSLRKEPKAYLFDPAQIDDAGARFENLVALHLHTAVTTWNSAGEGPVALNYLRDKEGHEADFALIEKGKVVCILECKTSDTSLSKGLLYFQSRFKVPVAVQLLQIPGICQKRSENGFTQWIISADRWLSGLV